MRVKRSDVNPPIIKRKLVYRLICLFLVFYSLTMYTYDENILKLEQSVVKIV